MAKDMNIQFKLDKRAINFFQREMPHKLTEAKEKAVTAAGMVWADEAKDITRSDDHIDTGLYVNSIGYVTGSPASNADVINDISESGSKTTLKIGSNVAYASHLEKHFNIMARALDASEDRMQSVAKEQIKRTLFG
jgi:hypothetical protein